MMMVSPKYRISQTATSAVCVMTCLMVAPNLKTLEIVRVSLFLIFLRTLPPIRFLLTMVMVLSFCIIAICVFQLLPVDTEEEFSCSMMEIAASSSGGTIVPTPRTQAAEEVARMNLGPPQTPRNPGA